MTHLSSTVRVARAAAGEISDVGGTAGTFAMFHMKHRGMAAGLIIAAMTEGMVPGNPAVLGNRIIPTARAGKTVSAVMVPDILTKTFQITAGGGKT